MPKREKYPTHSDAEESSVRLGPILGVRPGTYLGILYAIAIVVMLFFLFFFPGLRFRGQYVTVSTTPANSTVRVDGKYAGTSPCSIFLKSGDRKIEISRPFHETVVFEKRIRGRYFFTLFVPDRVEEQRQLRLLDPEGLIISSLGDFQKNAEIPQIITETTTALSHLNQNDTLYYYLDNCIKYITNESQIRELLYSYSLTSAGGSFLSSVSLSILAEKIVQIKQKYDNIPSWLLLAIPRSKSKKIVQIEWISQYLAKYRENISKYYQGLLPVGSSEQSPRSIAFLYGLRFHSIPRGELVQGKDDDIESFGKTIDPLLPHPITIKAFFLGETELSNRQFLPFIEENPEWSSGNSKILKEKNLVGDGYLQDWVGGKIPAGREDYPLTSVSYFTAIAYCEWLTKKLQPNLPGYTARLPTEAEWEWACRGGLRGMPYPLGAKPGSAVFFTKGITGPSRAGASELNAYGLRDMLGNVWEWCSDTFAPGAYLLSSFDPATNTHLAALSPAGPDKVVRGGSWNNQRELIKVFTRGSQPAVWCTPYLGFRVALSRP